MIHLKEMDWDDKWENYIEYGETDVDEQFRWDNFYNMDAPYIYQIISVMHQLKGKMTVYEAFLKGLEIYYCSTTCGRKSFLQNYRYVQNKIYKNIKKCKKWRVIYRGISYPLSKIDGLWLCIKFCK